MFDYLFLALFDLVGNVGVKLVMHLYQCTHVVRINFEAFLFQIAGSGKSSGDVGLDGSDLKTEELGMVGILELDARDGGPELAFFDESGGGLLIEGGDGLLGGLGLAKGLVLAQ